MIKREKPQPKTAPPPPKREFDNNLEFTILQDCSAFALQELLQIYRIEAHSKGEMETRGNKLWGRFPEHLQEILAPLLNTK